jgi:broad specificity phosphatase PhoE
LFSGDLASFAFYASFFSRLTIMNYLILVKHSLPEIIAGVSAEEWQLSDEGRRRCLPLAARLAHYRPDLLLASIEPKAMQTAELIAGALQMPWSTAVDLHEHRRRHLPFYDSATWQQLVADFFARPDELIFGQETAVQARDRFVTAVQAIVRQHHQQTILIVAHGTVITLFAAALAHIDPLPFWQSLTLPSAISFTLPSYQLHQTTLNKLTIETWFNKRKKNLNN